ncbi:hypothetical protein [Deferrisoma sp.]
MDVRALSGRWRRACFGLGLAAVVGLAACGGGGGGDTGAGGGGPPAGQAALDEAKTALASGDLEGAAQKLQGIAPDELPTEGKVVLSGLTLAEVVENALQDPDDPLHELLAQAGYELSGTSLWDLELVPLASGLPRRAARAVAQVAVDPSAAQALLSDLDEALALLDGVGPGVNFTLTVQGDTVEVDDADVYLGRAVLQGLKGVLSFALAYEYTGDPAAEPVLPDDLANVVLQSDASARLATAKSSFADALGNLDRALDALTGETDDQSDDLFTLDPEDEGYVPFLQETLSDLETSLSQGGHVPIRIWEVGDESCGFGSTEGTLDCSVSVYLTVLSADLSVLFDQPFEGTKVTPDAQGQAYLTSYFESLLGDVEWPAGGEPVVYFWSATNGTRIPLVNGEPVTAKEYVQRSGSTEGITIDHYTYQREADLGAM